MSSLIILHDVILLYKILSVITYVINVGGYYTSVPEFVIRVKWVIINQICLKKKSDILFITLYYYAREYLLLFLKHQS